MKTELLLELEVAMNSFIHDNCEQDWWPEGYVFAYEGLHQDMAKAAALVFYASVKGQEFAKENE